MEKNWLPPGQAPSARISPVRLSSLSRALLEGARTKTASSTTMGVPMLANQPEPNLAAHFSSISALVRGVLASVTPGEPDWPRNWGKSRGESAVMAEEAPVPAAPAAADGRQAAPAATASASSALNKRFFSCMGLHPFFAGRVVPPALLRTKKRAGFGSLSRAAGMRSPASGRDFPPKSRVSRRQAGLLARIPPTRFPSSQRVSSD